MLDEQQIRETIRRYVVEASEQFNDSHLLYPSRNDYEQEAFQGFTLDDLRGLEAALKSSNFSGEPTLKARHEGTGFTGDIQAEVCKLFELDLNATDRQDLQFLKACQAWTRATIELYESNLRQRDGLPAANETPYLSVTPTAAPPPTIPVIQGPRINEIIEDFLQDKQGGVSIRENTMDAYRQHVRAFTDVLGDLHVDAVTYDDARRLRDTLLKLPTNRNRKAAYRDKTVSQILAMDIPEAERLSGRTVSEIISALKAVFKWLKVTGKVVRIPANPITHSG